MIIAVPIFLIFMIIILRRGTISAEALMGAIWLFLLWSLTFTSHLNRDYFASDEIFYADIETFSLLSNRGLWLLLNSVISFSTEDVINHMRGLNLVFLLILYALAVQTFRTFRPFSIAILMSYFACVAALNLRDTLLFVALLILMQHYNPLQFNLRGIFRQSWWVIFASLVMLLLRPFQLGIMLFASLRWYYALGAFLIIFTILQSQIGQRYFYTIAWNFNNFEQSVSRRGEEKISDPTPTLTNIAKWTSRFIMAPLPWSSFSRIGDDSIYEYGKVDLTIRAAHRMFFYGFALYLLYQFIQQPRLSRQFISRYRYVIKFIILFSLVYAIFNFGGSHERIKMNVYLALFFLVDRFRMARRTSIRKYRIPHETQLSHPY